MQTLLRRVAIISLTLTSISTSALTLGITEGVTYKATDAEIEARFDGIAKALAAATKQPVKVHVISKYNALRDALKAGTVDFAFIHPAHVALEAIHAGNYRAVAWTSGFTEYKVSFLCKDTTPPIKTWASITGKAVVMPDADSVTSVMTRALLKENGLKASDVQVQYTRYQEAIPIYIENRVAEYGATASNGVIKAWKEKGGKVCAESRPMPIKQWLVSTAVPAATANTFRETLLSMDTATLGSSGYKGFTAPSTEQEKALISWLGIN